MADSNRKMSSPDTDPQILLPDEEMAELVERRWTAAKNWRRPKEQQWQRWYEMYRSYAKRKKWQNGVSLFIPLTFSTIESFLPRMVTQRPKIEVEARRDDKIEVAQNHRDLLTYQWDQLSMPVTQVDWAKEALIYGTGILKVGWWKMSRTKQFRNAMDPNQIETDTIVEENRPDINTVSLTRFYPAPGSKDVDSAYFTCEHHRWTWEHMRDLAEMGVLKMSAVKKLKARKNATNNDADISRLENQRQTLFGTSDPEQAKEEADIWEFDVVEYWEDSRYCILVPEFMVVLQNATNPYWHGKKPYLRIVDHQVPGEFYGIGEPEALQSIQTELNETHNLRLEAAKRAVFQMFKVRIGAPISQKQMEFKHQGIVWVTDQKDIEPLFAGNPQGPAYREEEVLRQWAQQTTGANDPFQGLGGDMGNETATGASILAQAANSRVGMKFLMMSEQGLRPLARMMMALNEQNVSDEERFRILGPNAQPKTLTPSDLATGGAIFDVRVDVVATDPINKEIALQKAMNFLGVFSQLYGDPTHPAVQAMMKRIADLAELDLPPEALQVQPNPDSAAAAQGNQPPAGGPASGSPNPSDRVAQALTEGSA